MSAADVPGNPARTARNAANSIVVSSDTRKTAMLATQNAGQGEARVAPRAITGAWVVAAVMAGSAADGLQIDGRVGRQAGMHLARDVIGKDLARAGFERVAG